MIRRDVIKGLAALGVMSIFPSINALVEISVTKLHFIGLGTGGANIAYNFKQKGITGKYTGINWFPSFIEPYKGLNHIEYEYPRQIRQSNELGKQSIPLTTEMKRTLSADLFYVLFVGLGAFTGTSLIQSCIEFLESNNKRYMAICTLPFKNEGQFRNHYANEKMADLKNYSNVLFFDNNEIVEKYGEDCISKQFARSDEEIYRIFKNEISNLIS